MDSPPVPPGNAGSRYRFSASRVAAVAFTVFALFLAWRSYVDYCVIVPTYRAMAQIKVTLPDKDTIGDELEIMTSPDVLSPIVTDLQLDKIWARRMRLPIDAMPMQDALKYLDSLLYLRPVPDTNIIDITVTSIVPKEASDVANAVANRYETVRELGAGQQFAAQESVLEGEIAEQTKVVAQKKSALETARIPSPGADAVTLARAAEAQLDTQQRALDDMQLKLRQVKADSQLAESPVRIISLADPPEYPSTPNHALDLIIAIVEAVCVAIIVPVLVELVLWYLSRLSPPADRPMSFPAPPAATSADY